MSSRAEVEPSVEAVEDTAKETVAAEIVDEADEPEKKVKAIEAEAAAKEETKQQNSRISKEAAATGGSK